MAMDIPKNGWIIMWKERGTVCTRLDRMIKSRLGKTVRVGHAGTLDPFAQGVLPIAFGSATRMIPFILRFPKTYKFLCTWGTATDTDDLTGEITGTSLVRPSYEEICAAIHVFTGSIVQKPCTYSAVKIQGVPAYTLARKGHQLELAEKGVTIYTFNILTPKADYTGKNILMEVTCSSGTYVRALARDLALHLGTLAHVSYLERTSVGPFTKQHAITQNNLDVEDNIPWDEKVYSVDYGLERLFPVIDLTGRQTLHLWNGLEVHVDLPFFSEFWVCKYQENMVCLSKGKQGGLIPYRCFIDPEIKNLLNMEAQHEIIS